jgi:hypothetical protein
MSHTDTDAHRVMAQAKVTPTRSIAKVAHVFLTEILCHRRNACRESLGLHLFAPLILLR